jgi:hypothetical protein
MGAMREHDQTGSIVLFSCCHEAVIAWSDKLALSCGAFRLDSAMTVGALAGADGRCKKRMKTGRRLQG